MSVVSATEEREFDVSRLLSAAIEEGVSFIRNFHFRFIPRLSIQAERLQAEGASGRDIELFQERLNRFGSRYGIRIPVSGVYDDWTRRGVAAFQREALYVMGSDGFVGPETARALRIKLLAA